VRGEVLRPARIQRERPRLRVHGQRRRSRRVHTDPDHTVARKARRPLRVRERRPDRHAKAVDVVGGILPRQVRLFGMEDDALLAARVVEHVRADDAPVRRVDDDRAYRVRPVVDSDGERRLAHLVLIPKSRRLRRNSKETDIKY
jgi:hypothetical protein